MTELAEREDMEVSSVAKLLPFVFHADATPFTPHPNKLSPDEVAVNFWASTPTVGSTRTCPVLVAHHLSASVCFCFWTCGACGQARREAVRPEEYGLLIARVSTLLYGINGEEVRRSGVLRAQAMQYRDDHGTAMRLADWGAIE